MPLLRRQYYCHIAATIFEYFRHIILIIFAIAMILFSTLILRHYCHAAISLMPPFFASCCRHDDFLFFAIRHFSFDITLFFTRCHFHCFRCSTPLTPRRHAAITAFHYC
jgi:hypothetical protein